MKNMTYAGMLEECKRMTPEQLAMNISVYSGERDEYSPVIYLGFTVENDVLEKDHPYLVIQ